MLDDQFVFFFPQTCPPIDSFLCKWLQGSTHGQVSCLLTLLNWKGNPSNCSGSFYLCHLLLQQYHLSTTRQMKNSLRSFFRRALIAQWRNVSQVVWIPMGSGEFRIFYRKHWISGEDGNAGCSQHQTIMFREITGLWRLILLEHRGYIFLPHSWYA